MKKSIFLMLFAALTMSMNAQDETIRYFFAPTGQGEEDGSSWENAAAAEYLGATLAGAEPGMEFYLMEGNYAPDINTNKWVIPQGVVLKGGYPSTMKGTKTSYNYALGGQSVFSADLDGDGKGDNTDYAFVYIGEGPATEKSEAYYKDWQKTEIWGITFRDGMRLNSKYSMIRKPMMMQMVRTVLSKSGVVLFDASTASSATTSRRKVQVLLSKCVHVSQTLPLTDRKIML